MANLPGPTITPAPRPAFLGRQYVHFRPRQTASDTNGNSAGVSVNGNGDAGISVGTSATDSGDTAASGQASATSSNGDENSSASDSTSSSSTSSPSSSPTSIPPTTSPPTTTSSTSPSTETSQTSSSSSSSSSSSQGPSTTSTSTSDSSSSSQSSSSSSTTLTSQSNPSSSSSSTITSFASSESSSSSQSSVTFVTIITTEPDGSVSTFIVPSSLSSELPNSKSTTARTAVIAGSTVGAVLFLVLLTVLASLFCWRRRKNRKLGFIEALTRRSKEGKGAGGVGLLDGEFDDDEEYRDELAGVQMRQRTIGAHSPQPSVGAGSTASLSGPTQNSQNANYPYNPAPTLYRARASDSGSMFHEEGVWPPPNHGTQFVDPFVPARELSKDSELGSIVDQVMGPNTSIDSSGLPPGAAPAITPGFSAATTSGSSDHVRGVSGSSVGSTTPKTSSPLAKTHSNPDPPRSVLTHIQNDSHTSFDATDTLSSSPLSSKPRNWLERQPKTPSPQNSSLTLPPPLNLSGSGSSSAPPSAFAHSASSLVSMYGTPHVSSPPTSAGTQKQTKRVSWGELPTPSRPSSRPGSRQGSITGGIGEAI